MKNKHYIIYIWIIIIVLSACKNDNSYLFEESTSFEFLKHNIVENNFKTSKVTLTAVGDIMFHEYQLRRAYDYNNSEFDFSNAFEYVSKYLLASDYTVGNLETTFAGLNGSRTNSIFQGYSCFPCFNTPDIAAKNIKDAGFNLVTTANNHSLDSNIRGLIRTLDVLEQFKINAVGTYRTKEDSEKIFIETINDIKFAFLGYTYSANGFSLPKEQEYMLNNLDLYKQDKLEKMYEDVRKAKEMDVDMVVVMIHYGNEYVKYPDEPYQIRISKQLVESGADIVLGSHPHVLQPIELHKYKANGIEHEGLIFYSLGNFLSSQQGDATKDTDIGVIADIYIEKKGNSKPIIKGISLIPTFTYWTKDVIGIIPVHEGVNNEKLGHLFNGREKSRLKHAYENSINHLLYYIKADYKFDGDKYNVVF